MAREHATSHPSRAAKATMSGYEPAASGSHGAKKETQLVACKTAATAA
jgi:hypothetical protein